VLAISVALFYDCMADVLMTALDFEHQSLVEPLLEPAMIGRCP
jgi:hypothetical protein